MWWFTISEPRSEVSDIFYKSSLLDIRSTAVQWVWLWLSPGRRCSSPYLYQQHRLLGSWSCTLKYRRVSKSPHRHWKHSAAYLGANDSWLLCSLWHRSAHSNPLVVKTGKWSSWTDYCGQVIFSPWLDRPEHREQRSQSNQWSSLGEPIVT